MQFQDLIPHALVTLTRRGMTVLGEREARLLAAVDWLALRATGLKQNREDRDGEKNAPHQGHKRLVPEYAPPSQLATHCSFPSKLTHENYFSSS